MKFFTIISDSSHAVAEICGSGGVKEVPAQGTSMSRHVPCIKIWDSGLSSSKED